MVRKDTPKDPIGAAERDPKNQVTGWCDTHGHETITCTACGAQWCPEPGHGCNCGKPAARS